MQKKLKYASYTMGGCSDLAVDIKMDGQDKINHSCKVYGSFFATRESSFLLHANFLSFFTLINHLSGAHAKLLSEHSANLMC